jgi:hypothetical protein
MPIAEISEDAWKAASLRSEELRIQAEFLNMRARAVTTTRSR